MDITAKRSTRYWKSAKTKVLRRLGMREANSYNYYYERKKRRKDSIDSIFLLQSTLRSHLTSSKPRHMTYNI